MLVLEKRSALDEEILPRVFCALPSVFPEFGWVPRRGQGGWVSTNRSHTKSLCAARPSRVVCNEPTGFYVFGQGSTHWLAYLNGGSFPAGSRWKELVEEIATRAGASSLVAQPTPKLEVPSNERALAKLAGAAQTLLRENPGAAWRYARSRGICDGVVFSRELGFVPSVDEWFETAGVSRAEVSTTRGMLWSERLWGNRLVAPWRNLRGDVVALWGRCLDGAVGVGIGSRPKYAVAGDRPMLYGHDRALPGREVVLIEGHMNLLELESAGLRGVASLGGDGVPAGLFEALAEVGVEKVTLGFDGDEAGMLAAARAQRGMTVPRPLAIEVRCSPSGNPTPAVVAQWIAQRERASRLGR